MDLRFRFMYFLRTMRVTPRLYFLNRVVLRNTLKDLTALIGAKSADLVKLNVFRYDHFRTIRSKNLIRIK